MAANYQKLLQERLGESLKQFGEGNFDDSVPLLREFVQEQNAYSMSVMRQLARLAFHTKDRVSVQRKESAKSVLNELNLIPPMNEAMVNAMRESVGNSYRAQRLTAWPLAMAAKRAPAKFIAKKNNARRFSQNIGLRLPELYQEGVEHEEIVISERAVVKPLWEDGGRAVHGFQRNGNTLVDRFNGETYASIEDVKQLLRNYIETRFVAQDAWIVEEMIVPESGDPADSADIKFFTFYGRVGYILQVERWGVNGVRRIMFDRQGVPVDASDFYKLPEGPVSPKFTDDDVRMAEMVSLKIPWPGVRIDFLTSANGLVFGEFTFNPGAYGGYHRQSDEFLGREWAQASARLYDDFLAGKDFKEYRDFMEANIA